MRIQKIELKVMQTDITECVTDAIVNPTNNQLKMEKGLALVIKEKGGVFIEKDAISKGPIGFGEAIWTLSGALKTKYIVHVAVLGMDLSTDEQKIRQATANALACAQKINVRSITFPVFGCEKDFPVVGAAKIMAQEILKFAREESKMEEIIICADHPAIFEQVEQTVHRYVDHIQNDLSRGPYVTVDIIIELEEGIILIERSNPPYGWALPGGFLDYGESLEETAIREAKEETSMELEGLRQFHTYSKPGRDPRFQTVSTVFIAKGKGTPQFGDDAKGLKVVPYGELLRSEYAFDHRSVIEDYLKQRKLSS